MSFIRRHFGSDILIGTWLLVLGALLYVIIMIYYLNYSIAYYDDYYYTDDFIVTDDGVLLGCSIVFLLATLYFVKSSYPEEMKKFMDDVANVDTTKLTFTQRYFTGNSWLIATWLSAIATLPYFAYPIWAYENGYYSLTYFILYILALTIVFAFIGLWIVAVFPESLQKNNGQGSSYFYDNFLNNNYICCCADKEFLKRHCGSDFLVGSWVFAIISVISLPPAIIYVCDYPHDIMSYVSLLCVLFFALGSLLFVYATYPSNFNTCYFYQRIFCDPDYDNSDLLGTVTERSSVLRNSEL